jgi:OOP family OmpA-OmpF porin
MRRRFGVVLGVVLPSLLALVLVACDDPQSVVRRPAQTATLTAADETAGPNTVIIKDFKFSPQRITVKHGTTVLWVNHDGTQHIVFDDGNEWSLGVIGPGGASSFQFDNPGTHGYHCSIHPSMKGTLVVQ